MIGFSVFLYPRSNYFMQSDTIKAFLEKHYAMFNRTEFIAEDPIIIPHRFSKKEDIEIAGFFSAILAWGQRKTIIAKANELMHRMDNAPFDFITTASERELSGLIGFKHRTFNGDDCLWFATSLKSIYLQDEGLEKIFSLGFSQGGAYAAIELLFSTMTSTSHLPRSEKHLARPSKGSAAKRINMFLRWMVRIDNHGVDFGLWKNIPKADLICPLDLHSGRTARALGLISRPANDWIAATELTMNLKKFDPIDPVKYDFALFGAGIHKTMI
jgi:uncharacterized protein (TIGR02757 family)